MRYVYSLEFNLDQLKDELLAAVPELRPVKDIEQFTIERQGGDVLVTLHDNALDHRSKIANSMRVVVAHHVPKKGSRHACTR